MPEAVFQESAAKVAIGFFLKLRFFENAVFGHVTEVPTYGVDVYIDKLYILPSFSTGLVKTESGFIVRSVETGLGR